MLKNHTTAREGKRAPCRSKKMETGRYTSTMRTGKQQRPLVNTQTKSKIGEEAK